eukprot:TRINITY_DN52531_c0_g1_i1.p1 TRINITY_DN52531_c0_g1~~TRINITY_DN52531_c0_g1_i1.p1  ORF type:complete len:125 (+),score=1.63 TRINITY_DN52531_c0_g1_i1:64-438(+)
MFFKDFSLLSFSWEGTATIPNPSPCSVSTITRSPKLMTKELVLKSYILPAVLNLTPVIFTIKLASLLKVPINCQITFMFCCGVSLAVDRPGQPMAVIQTKTRKGKKRSRVSLVPLLDSSLFSVS